MTFELLEKEWEKGEKGKVMEVLMDVGKVEDGECGALVMMGLLLDSWR